MCCDRLHWSEGSIHPGQIRRRGLRTDGGAQPYSPGAVTMRSLTMLIGLQLLLLLVVLVRPGLQKLQSLSPPVLELSTDLNVFSDPVAGHQGGATAQKRYFRYLSLDPTNENYLYVGSVDYVYRLDASYISENYLKSSNLSSSAIGAVRDHLVNCLARRKDPLLSCQNHVRAVIRADKTRLFVCSTGIDSPMVYYLNYSNLDVISLDQKGGRAKCPFDPSSNYTIVYVEKGNPGGVATTYSGTVTDFSNSDSVIYRPPLTGPDAKEYRLLRTEQDSRWLNDPQFVGSFDVGDYVFFFFREQAMEQANCAKVVFSRVARICKRDEGGNSLSMDYRWTTFLKARLNCSVPGEIPFYFNEIYDVSFNRSEQTFYGLFRTVQSGFWGSAVCAFSVDSVNRVFDQSPFKGQQNFETGWFPIPERETPTPRPGQCRHSSLDLSTSALSFVKHHPLLHDMVDPAYGRPLYFTKDDLALTRLAVHTVGDHKVFFLGSSRGVVYKAAHWLDNDGHVQFVTVAILKPFRNAMRPIWQMLIHTMSAIKTTYLYLSTDDAVVQLQTEDCFRYTPHCRSCLTDPYCTWNAQLSTCQPHHSNMPKQIFNVIEEVCNKACQPSHKPYTSTREVLQGVPLHLNCTPTCLAPSSSSAKVIWHFSDASSARLVKIDYEEYILSQDFGLVVLDVRSRHNGTFSCSVNGYIVARHQVKVLPCRLNASKEETWRVEFAKWCNAFSAYTQEYNHWVCLKKQCLKESCIPQKVSDKCQIDKLSAEKHP